MNLDRLYAILHPLDYLGAVRQQLLKEKEKHTFKKNWGRLVMIYNQAWRKRFGVPMLTFLLCLVSGNFEKCKGRIYILTMP